MICSKCGNTIPDDSLFCVKCGAMIEAPAPEPQPAGETAPADDFQPDFGVPAAEEAPAAEVPAAEPAVQETPPEAPAFEPAPQEFQPAAQEFQPEPQAYQPPAQTIDPAAQQNFQQNFQQNYGPQYQQPQYVPQPVQPPVANYNQPGYYGAPQQPKTSSGAFDFGKVVSFITGYFKSPTDAVKEDIEGGDMLSIIIFGAFYFITGILMQTPLLRHFGSGMAFTFIFSFLFTIISVALPFGISTVLGMVNKIETKPVKQIFATVLNTPLVAVCSILTIILGLISFKLYIILLVITAVVYATAMYPVIREKLPEKDTIVLWLCNLASALAWVIVIMIILGVEFAVISNHAMDIAYGMLY